METQQTSGYRQIIFVRYTTGALIDMVVLGLFAEYWSAVDISSFSYLLLVAIALQLMLKATLSVEHSITAYIDRKRFRHAKSIRVISLWVLLLVSKLLMLAALSLLFSHNVEFHGRWHGVIPFLIVLFTMLGAEALMHKIYLWFGGRDLFDIEKTESGI